MSALWEADTWLTIRDIRDRMDYAPVGYTTVATVVGILTAKGLLVRQLGDRDGKPGPPAWWYRPARPVGEHVGEQIAALLDHCPDPGAALDYAIAARGLPSTTKAVPDGELSRPGVPRGRVDRHWPGCGRPVPDGS